MLSDTLSLPRPNDKGMTLAYLPWTRDEDARVVHRSVGQINPVDLRGGGTNYARFFEWLWEGGGPYIIVEHDVVPWPGAVKQLRQCHEPWCAFAYGEYDIAAEAFPPMGCAKFDPRGLDLPFEDYPDWSVLDREISNGLAQQGVAVHQHYPGVTHLDRPYGISGDYRR